MTFGCVVALSAAAQSVFSWTDSAGVTHFTDDRSTIPRGATVRQLGDEDPDVMIRVSPERSSDNPDAGRAEPPREADDSARREREREASWRQRFTRARTEVERLELLIDKDQRLLDDPTSAPSGSRGRPTRQYEGAKGRLAKNRDALTRAREALADLERAASNEAVPLEWRR